MHQHSLFASDNSAAPSASLDPLETPVEPLLTSAFWDDAPALYELRDVFRHSGWRRQRQLIFDAFLDLTRSGYRIEIAGDRPRAYVYQPNTVPFHRIEAFRTCGTGFWILRHTDDPARFRIVPSHCHDRWCTPCSAARRNTIRKNLDRLVSTRPHRFLTLTIRHHEEPLSELIRRLYAGFRRLRQRQLWRDRVDGGVAFLEVSFNPETRSWHPHLHCVLEGSYVHRPDLTRAWLEVTGDSHAVDIRIVRNRSRIIDYISKYSTKPIPASAVDDPAALREAIATLTGRRFLIQFGAWRRWKLLDLQTDENWTLYCHEADLPYLATSDDPLAENVLAMLPTADPFTGEFVVILDGVPPDQ